MGSSAVVDDGIVGWLSAMGAVGSELSGRTADLAVSWFGQSMGNDLAAMHPAPDAICIKHGDKPFELLERKHVTAIRDARIDAPGAANNIVKAISALFAGAIEVGEAKTNPCNGIKRLSPATGFTHGSLRR
ncbi:hypothetical protein [Rhizobium sp. 007]|uniref:hypothetical protein n=1 Tax=Rhizobium sp. 007 TaxID=2785056 RepID=UPI0018906797|nr:hypothetical protein [Rhizobium sp. 007]QPB22152.1 hypothetical protein ISN39_11040 [Rhizobium sp. 007]